MSESATLERPRSANGTFKPVNPPQNATIKAVTDFLQAHIDQTVKGQPLPTVIPGQPPLEDYDTVDKNGDPIRKTRTRRACETDAKGNVVYGSGPVVTDDAAMALLNMVLPHLEQFCRYTQHRMSECLAHPDSGGVIDDRSKVIRVPSGRFVFVPGNEPVRAG